MNKLYSLFVLLMCGTIVFGQQLKINNDQVGYSAETIKLNKTDQNQLKGEGDVFYTQTFDFADFL